MEHCFLHSWADLLLSIENVGRTDFISLHVKADWHGLSGAQSGLCYDTPICVTIEAGAAKLWEKFKQTNTYSCSHCLGSGPWKIDMFSECSLPTAFLHDKMTVLTTNNSVLNYGNKSFLLQNNLVWLFSDMINICWVPIICHTPCRHWENNGEQNRHYSYTHVPHNSGERSIKYNNPITNHEECTKAMETFNREASPHLRHEGGRPEEVMVLELKSQQQMELN